MTTNPGQPDDHPELSRRLRGLYAPRADVPESVNRRVFETVSRELASATGGGSRRVWWSSVSVRTWASVAAVVALLFTAALATILYEVESEPETVAIDSRQPFILQALARARTSGEDRAVALVDAERLATMAVKLQPVEWNDHGHGPAILLDDKGHVIGAQGAAPRKAQKAELAHFTAIDVTINPRGNSLAVYQLRIKLVRGAMKVVGVESGDGAFAAKPPYYDRKALDKPDAEEIVIAMFVTADNAKLPIGKTRVATIHLMTRDEGVPAFEAKLETAAGPDGKPFAADMEIRTTPPALPGDRS